MPKVQNAKTLILQKVILPNLFHQQLNLPEQNTNHSNKDITWSTPGHDWQNGWKTIYVVSTCRTDDSTKAAHFWFDDWFVFSCHPVLPMWLITFLSMSWHYFFLAFWLDHNKIWYSTLWPFTLLAFWTFGILLLWHFQRLANWFRQNGPEPSETT